MSPAPAVPRRADVAFVLLAGFGLALIGRLYQCQVRNHEEALAEARAQATDEEILPALTGRLLDTRGRLLAVSLPVESIFADPLALTEAKSGNTPERAAAELAPILGLDPSSLLSDLSADAAHPRRFVWIKRRVTDDEANAVRSLHLPGIGFRTEYRRSYPNGSLAAHFLQGRGVDEQPLGGLEAACNRWLRGRDGRRTVGRDALGRSILVDPASMVPPAPGADVRLTLDAQIQSIAEEELEAACAEWHPSAAIALVLDPYTGEILAGAVRPTFDPNTGIGAPDARRNRIISDPYEPGSTMKPLITSWYFDHHLGSPTTRFDCENGLFRYRARTLHDHHPYGRLTVEEIIAKSSNIGAAKIGLAIGDERLQECIRAFGFGKSTGCGLPGEDAGQVTSPSKWSYFTTTSVPMGHEINVTTLQLARAYAALANGGYLVWPHIVRQVESPDGVIIQEARPTALRRAVGERAVRDMTVILSKVVEEGTGTKAKLVDLSIAGKTGTAQKTERGGGYGHDAHVASFIAFAPVEHPQVLAIVLLDSPQREYYGGTVAAPACARILERTVKYLAIPSPLARMNEETHVGARNAGTLRSAAREPRRAPDPR